MLNAVISVKDQPDLRVESNPTFSDSLVGINSLMCSNPSAVVAEISPERIVVEAEKFVSFGLRKAALLKCDGYSYVFSRTKGYQSLFDRFAISLLAYAVSCPGRCKDDKVKTVAERRLAELTKGLA